MPPGSRKSSAASNSSTSSPRIATEQPGTVAILTPQPPAPQQAPHSVESSPSSVPSCSTCRSVGGFASITRKGKRGPTLGKRVRRTIRSYNGERLHVYVTREMRAFCGKNATAIANELGSQIRRSCAIIGFPHSWKDVEDGLQSAIIRAVQERFVVNEDGIENTPLVMEVFHKRANIYYKDWKWRMGVHYNRMKEEGRDPYQHPYQDIDPDVWKFMIDHRFNDPDPKWGKRKQAGKNNRNFVPEGQTLGARKHTLGSRSFPAAITIEADNRKERIQRREEERRQRQEEGLEDGHEEEEEGPDFCALYKASRTLKDTGGWVDPKCKEYYDKMIAIRDEVAQSGTPLTGENFQGEFLVKQGITLEDLGSARCPHPTLSNPTQVQYNKYQKNIKPIWSYFARSDLGSDRRTKCGGRRREDAVMRNKDEEMRNIEVSLKNSQPCL